VVFLLSPTKACSQFLDANQVGGLFTMFLNSVLTATSFICKVGEIQGDVWKKSTELVEGLEAKVIELIAGVPDLGMF
jgi:hypothetical protein